MGGNASANNMLTGGEGGSKKPDFVLTLYVYLPIGRKITIFFWLHCVVCPREENTFGEKKCYYMMRLNNTLVNMLCTLGRIRVFLCFALAEN